MPHICFGMEFNTEQRADTETLFWLLVKVQQCKQCQYHFHFLVLITCWVPPTLLIYIYTYNCIKDIHTSYKLHKNESKPKQAHCTISIIICLTKYDKLEHLWVETYFHFQQIIMVPTSMQNGLWYEIPDHPINSHRNWNVQTNEDINP